VQALDVHRVLDAPGGMFKRELSDLAVDPRLVDCDGAWSCAETGNDGRDGRLVELDPRDLSEDRLLPRLVPVPRLLAPRVAWPRVELAVAAVGECSLVADAATAGAEQEPAEQIDPGPAMDPPPWVLERRTYCLLDPASGYEDPGLADLDRRIILVCADGYSSSMAAATLRDLGFSLAGNLDRGFNAWQAAGLPVDPV
jgi:rhodanese-related sulfurtransferase